MVTLHPKRESPLDIVDRVNRDSIRASIAALQVEHLHHEPNQPDAPLEEERSHAPVEISTEESMHRRYLPNNEERSAREIQVVAGTTGVIALIAAYNEARFIGSMVIGASRYVDRVIVVDDGSHDETVAIARAAGADVIEMESNGGKGAAIQCGLNVISGLADIRAIVLLDGDGQHDPLEIPTVIKPILAGEADLVVGSRFLHVKSDIPAWRQVGQHGLTWFTNVASGTPLSDSQSGFRALSPQAAKKLKFQTSDFSMESEMQFAVYDLGLTAVEMPITCVYEEPSKRNPIAHGLEVVFGIVRLTAHIRPLFFGTISAIALWLVGAALSLDVLMVFNHSGHLPLASSLLMTGMIAMGCTAFICGIMLQSVRDLMKNYFLQNDNR